MASDIVKLKKFENSFFSSNSYIMWRNGFEDCYVIDCGDSEPLFNFIQLRDLNPKYVFLTHGHFDHIYGLNAFLSEYPKTIVFASNHTQKLLFDNRLNYSLFHEKPWVYEGAQERLHMLSDCQKISLWDDNLSIKAMRTPGHDQGCMSFLTDEYFFTGDSYIPGIKTVTNLRGNKQQAAESEVKIKAIIADRGITVCPGHGDISRRID